MLIEKKRSKIFWMIDQLEHCFQINKQNENPNVSKQSVQLNQNAKEIGTFDDGQQQMSDANNDQEKDKQIEKDLEYQIFEEVNDFSQFLQRVKTNINEIKKAIYQPIPQGYRAFCVLKRNKSLLSSNFQLFFEDEDEPIMFSQKVYGIKGSNYLFDLTKSKNKSHSTYLGKLKGNAMGSSYSLYSAGNYPQKDNNRKQWRICMGKIEYETNFLGLNGPRKITVSLPKVQSIQQFDRFKLNQKECNEIFKSSYVRQFRNKNPCWAQNVKSYVLDFRGRVKIGSIRNFLLIPSQTNEEAEDQTNENLLFGKINENTFIMEVSYPISLFQAFSIAVSQFDFKFNCQ